MSETSRSRLLTAITVVGALFLWYVMFSGRVQDARARCIERGGQVVIESDPLSIGHYCVLPNGERERL